MKRVIFFIYVDCRGERERWNMGRAAEESNELKQCITTHMHINAIMKPIVLYNNFINNGSRNKKMEDEQKDSQGRGRGSERFWGKGFKGELIKMFYTYL